MFVDGLTTLKNGKMSELMPNTVKFFEDGTTFKNHHATLNGHLQAS